MSFLLNELDLDEEKEQELADDLAHRIKNNLGISAQEMQDTYVESKSFCSIDYKEKCRELSQANDSFRAQLIKLRQENNQLKDVMGVKDLTNHDTLEDFVNAKNNALNMFCTQAITIIKKLKTKKVVSDKDYDIFSGLLQKVL